MGDAAPAAAGFPYGRDRPMQALSGGEKQRLPAGHRDGRPRFRLRHPRTNARGSHLGRRDAAFVAAAVAVCALAVAVSVGTDAWHPVFSG